MKTKVLVRIGAMLSGFCIWVNAVFLGTSGITVNATDNTGTDELVIIDSEKEEEAELEVADASSEDSQENEEVIKEEADENNNGKEVDGENADNANELSDEASAEITQVETQEPEDAAGSASSEEEDNIKITVQNEEFMPQIVEYINEESGFNHPGVGLTKEMLDTVQNMVNASAEPWMTYYNDMLVSTAASKDITINMTNPETTAYNSQGTNGKFIKDALTAYTQAILYYISGDNIYRKNCMDIIRRYEKLNPDSYAYFTDACIHTGIPMNRFCMALEIMRCSTYTLTEGYADQELCWTDEDTDLIIRNFVRPSVETFMSSPDEFMNQHLYTTIGAMSAYLFMDDAQGYAKTVEWFTVNKDGANPGFNGSIKRLFRKITTIDEIGMKEGEGIPLETPVIQHVEMGRDQAHGCGDLTNAAILSRLTNAQGTKVDPENGTVSTSENAVGVYEFLDDRIVDTADFFFKYMLGYDSQWVQVPFSMRKDGTIIDNYTEFASGYRGRYTTINFWDIYTYYKYTRGMSDDEIAGRYPYFWEGFMKKMPSNFMWNGGLNINWDNVDGGGDFWLFLPKEAANDENYIAKAQCDYLVEVEDRGTFVENAESIGVYSEDGIEYVRVNSSDGMSKIAITSGGGSGYDTYAFKIRTDGIANMSFENGVKGKIILPDTHNEWKYVTYTLKSTESFGDLYYICLDNIQGSYVDLDSIDIKATDSNSARTINVVSFEAGSKELEIVTVSGEDCAVALQTVASSSVEYSLMNAPENVEVSSEGLISIRGLVEGTYDLYAAASSGETVAAKKVTIYVASTREEAIEIAGRKYDPEEVYTSDSLQKYLLAKNEAKEALGLDQSAFREKLSALSEAVDALLPVSPLLKYDLYTDGDSLDLTDMVVDTTLGNMIVLQDSDPSFCNRLDGKFNSHIIDFGQDYKVSASKFGFKARLGFADRIAGAQVFGSNDKVNWTRLTTEEASYTMAFQTVDVQEDQKSEKYRYLKIQKTTEYPESLRGAYSNMLEFSELRIWGARTEIGNVIESISLSSESAAQGRIRMGDTVAVTIRTRTDVESITVNIQDHVVEATKAKENLWTAFAVMESGTRPGTISLIVDYVKADGTAGNTMYGSTDGTTLQLLDSDSYIDTRTFAKVLTATSGSWDKKSSPQQCAGYLFDRDVSTFGDLLNSNGDFYVIDYGESVSVRVKSVLMMPRSTAANHASRLNGARLYGTNDELVFEADGSYSNSSNKNVKWTAITPAVSGAAMNTWSEFGSDAMLTDESFRYFKIAEAQQGDIAEVEIYGDYNSDIESVVNAITTAPDQGPDKRNFKYPEVPSGYRLEIYSSDNASILSLDGTYVAPKEDTVVNVVIEVTRLSDNKTGLTPVIPVLFKSIKGLIEVPKVLRTGTKEISNSKAYDDYTFSVESTSNEALITKDGDVICKDEDEIVDVALRVTRKSDGVFAVGDVVSVLVCGENGSRLLDIPSIAQISCSDGSNAAASVFDGNINTFADVSTNAYHVLDFGEGKRAIVTGIRIYPRSDSNDNNAKRTEGAVLYGSNDGSNWIALTRPVSNITKGVWKEIAAEEFLGFGKFRYYRIGGNTRGSMAEVELLGSYDNGDLKGSFYTKWGATYFRMENGENAVGLQRIDGNTYYFKPKGNRANSEFITIDDKTYYFKADGTMAVGFITKWMSTYYFDESGAQVKDCLVDYEGDTYFLNSRGAMVKSDFVDFEDGRHYFDSEGKMVRGRTITKWTKKYTFDENGVLIK